MRDFVISKYQGRNKKENLFKLVSESEPMYGGRQDEFILTLTPEQAISLTKGMDRKYLKWDWRIKPIPGEGDDELSKKSDEIKPGRILIRLRKDRNDRPEMWDVRILYSDGESEHIAFIDREKAWIIRNSHDRKLNAFENEDESWKKHDIIMEQQEIFALRLEVDQREQRLNGKIVDLMLERKMNNTPPGMELN